MKQIPCVAFLSTRLTRLTQMRYLIWALFRKSPILCLLLLKFILFRIMEKIKKSAFFDILVCLKSLHCDANDIWGWKEGIKKGFWSSWWYVYLRIQSKWQSWDHILYIDSWNEIGICLYIICGLKIVILRPHIIYRQLKWNWNLQILPVSSFFRILVYNNRNLALPILNGLLYKELSF